jgi:hypothetical protein
VTADSTGSRPSLGLNTATALPAVHATNHETTCANSAAESGTHVPEKCPRGLAHVDSKRYSPTRVTPQHQAYCAK